MNEILDWINETYDINETYKTKVEYNDNGLPNHNSIAIIGGSGSGKTTLLKHWLKVDNVTFSCDREESIFEILAKSTTEEEMRRVSKLLFDVGLASIPIWKNQFSTLSNGEKLRFEIAYKLNDTSNDLVFIDEFTSMLDRQTAKNLTRNLNQLIRDYGKRLVVATAHYDILDWLEIDLLVDTTSKKSHTPQQKQILTLTSWRYMQLQESCGVYLASITI